MKYEIVSDNCEPTYNLYSGEYEMVPEGASPEFNLYNEELKFMK